MNAFHNDEAVKQKYLSRVLEHEKADEIIQGKYWENGKGCSVGCTIHGSDHMAYEKELGIPMWMAKIEDRIFEGLPLNLAKKWPSEFLNAITPGQDLNLCFIPMLIFIVESAREKFDHVKYPDKLKYIDDVLGKLQKNSTPIATAAAYATATAAATAAAAYATAAAAYAAAAYAAAAYAAATAAAAYATAAAAYAAAAYAAAAYAAAAYADAAYAAAARRGFIFIKNNDSEAQYIKFANRLLEIIKGNYPLRTSNENCK